MRIKQLFRKMIFRAVRWAALKVGVLSVPPLILREREIRLYDWILEIQIDREQAERFGSDIVMSKMAEKMGRLIAMANRYEIYASETGPYGQMIKYQMKIRMTFPCPEES